jgi:hypothetical protein|tara:strand:+ start:513 stop:803 length:291 start_codon:yes stop_codon:yes gene_type:complete
MHIDVEIYLKNVKDFLSTGTPEIKQMLKMSESDLDTVMLEIETIAVKNFMTKEDPTLTKKQMLDSFALTRAKKEDIFAGLKKPVYKIKGFGEICLN